MAYDLPQHLDSTMMNAFRACHQLYFREYGEGLRPAETSIDLHAGAVFASTLERYRREVFLHALSDTPARAAAFATFTHEWGDFEIRNPKSPKTSDNMWAAFEHYLNTFPARTDSIQPYFTSDVGTFEFSFAIPLDFPGFPRHPVSGDPFIYTGRFDMFGKYRGTKPCVSDEKTASRLDSSWAEKWNLRSQFLGYCWALQHNGIPCDTVIIRGIVVTLSQAPRIVEAIKIFPKHLVERWFEQLRRDLIRLVECHETGYWDFNFGDACTAFNRSCNFMTLCQSNQPEQWIDNYSVRRWNPLSRNPISDAPTTVALQFTERGNIPPKYQYMEVA